MGEKYQKRNSKTYRLIALITILAVLATGIGASAMSSDIPSSWAQGDVDIARSKGLVIAEADQNYQANISRRLFCALIVNMVERILGQTVVVTVTNPFHDTSDTDIIKAYQLGIVSGVSATRFAPHDFITREQIAAMMMRGARKLDEIKGTSYAAISDTTAIIFADQNEISYWALEEVKNANSLGILRGVGGNRINPKGNTTVEQGILLINRVFDGYTTYSGNAGTSENRAPIAISNPVVFSVPEQTELIISASQLATDPDGDTLSIIRINGQTENYNTINGTASLIVDGKCAYTSRDIATNVTDDFVVTVSDGINQTHVNVRVNVTFSLVLIIKPTITFVTVNGTAVMNETLSAGIIGYLGQVPSPEPELSYQWMRATSPSGTYTDIPGETEAFYAIPQNDLGKYLKLKVTASGSASGNVTSPAKGPVSYGFAGGSGTFSDPYLIATAKQFMLLEIVPTAGKYFKLISDIELARDVYIKNVFYGTLNGDGYAVTIDLRMPGETQHAGLFASTGKTASTSAKIMNLTVAGQISSQVSYAGGVVGYNRGTISQCLSNVSIAAKNYVGGIAGANSGIIERCGVVSGHVTGTRGMIGGLVGINSATGGVANSFARTDVFGSGNEGGLIGYNQGGVQYCYSAGKVDGYNNIGGLVGHNDGGTVSYSYYDKETSGRSDTGRGIPRTTSQMKTQSTYVAWDFTYIWSISTGQYPALRKE
ncbi:MAG: S-layer homology domain-containing protein [Clostridiales bacterium]|nr:S-layer homology domain-containing protein [Clostridiales bacterium]